MEPRPGSTRQQTVAGRASVTPQFILIGFSQEGSVRHFSFHRCRNDGSKRDITVDADTNLIRRFGISLQDLPLLCRQLLDETQVLTTSKTLVFGEDRMRQHADERETIARIAQETKRTLRKPKVDNLGQA